MWCLRHGRDLGEGLALVHELALLDSYVGDVVVVRDEAEPARVVVDRHVSLRGGRVPVDPRDAAAVGRMDAVPGGGREVDGLMKAGGEMDVGARGVGGDRRPG
jgi:hypothetical protein